MSRSGLGNSWASSLLSYDQVVCQVSMRRERLCVPWNEEIVVIQSPMERVDSTLQRYYSTRMMRKDN